jgi:hypothetical protein
MLERVIEEPRVIRNRRRKSARPSGPRSGKLWPTWCRVRMRRRRSRRC